MSAVFITGSGSRIGRGLALEFAKKGWNVIVHYNTSKKKAEETVREIVAPDRKAIAVQADLANVGEIDRAWDEAVEKLGAPDVLVNNAGIFPEKRPLKDVDVDFWDNTMNVNLRSMYYLSRKFSMAAGENARIVNIGSLGGLEIWKERIPYNVSKAGVIQLTQALARELAPDIAVNCVAPGSIYLPDDRSPNEKFMAPTGKIPMGRWGNVTDIFEAVYFFSTASKYITGQILSVDGGYHIMR